MIYLITKSIMPVCINNKLPFGLDTLNACSQSSKVELRGCVPCRNLGEEPHQQGGRKVVTMARNSKESAKARSTWCVTASDEAHIYVVGSTKQLGEWDTHKALQMQRIGDASHQRTINLSLQRGEPVEFKFVAITPNGDLHWEEGENRAFTPATGDSTIDWGDFRSAC